MSGLEIRRIGSDEAKKFTAIIKDSPYKRYQYIRRLSAESQVQYHLFRLERAARESEWLAIGALDGDRPIGVVISQYLAWDSEVIGIPCARILEGFYDASLPFEQACDILGGAVGKTLTHWRKEKEIVFADARSDARDLIFLQALEANGYGLIESSLVYAYDARETKPPEAAQEAITRPGESRDLPVIERIAGAMFTNDRFHRDPRFPKGTGNRVYERWLENVLEGKRGHLEVLEVEGRIAGFHTGYLDDEFNQFSETKVGIYDLIAIIPNPRFLKAWETIIAGITRVGIKYGAEIGEGRTQVHNIGTMFRLLRLPPSYTRSEVTFHWWAKSG